MWWDYRLTWYGACCANMAVDQKSELARRSGARSGGHGFIRAAKFSKRGTRFSADFEHRRKESY